LPDIVIGNKKGTFVLHHKTQDASAADGRLQSPNPSPK